MKTITATVPAWITDEYVTLADLNKTRPERAISSVSFYLPHGEKGPDGWVQIGAAEITLTLHEPAKVAEGQIAVLREAKQRLQAETQMKLNAIDERIGKLLCLEHKPEEPA